jgi:hypothetical protein
MLVLVYENDLGVLPSKGVEHRYPALQEVTMSRTLMHADLVPAIQDMALFPLLFLLGHHYFRKSGHAYH